MTHSSHSFPGSLHRPMYFPLKYKMTAQLLLNEMLDFSLEEENLVNSDDDDIPILVAVATYMRRDLHRNKGFYENILPAYTIDEFTNTNFSISFSTSFSINTTYHWHTWRNCDLVMFLNQEPPCIRRLSPQYERQSKIRSSNETIR